MHGTTNSVGILAPYHINPYFTEIVDAIEKVLAQNGVFFYLCNCVMNFELEKQYTEELLERNIGAVIAIETPSMNTTDNYFLSKKFDCPVILINQHFEPFGDNYVVRCDQKPGLQELLEQVRERELFPFYMFFGAGRDYSFLLKERLLKNWKKKYRLTDMEARVIHYEKLKYTSDENAVWYTNEYFKEVLSSTSRPRAILAGNELMALGALIAERELGIAVPQELAVVGVDNTLLARTSFPPLTTIDLHMQDVGSIAANLFMDIRNNPDENRKKVHIIPSNLYFRQTF
jgi:LacI family transcriptional regulator